VKIELTTCLQSCNLNDIVKIIIYCNQMNQVSSVFIFSPHYLIGIVHEEKFVTFLMLKNKNELHYFDCLLQASSLIQIN